ncbi:MAG TPA: 4-alpha-glucanotransferase, partial [Ilumatobacteraceae bacterium]|nr:4-alpha-glucanotransferase [Ilumatobacteraceae bacterium]
MQCAGAVRIDHAMALQRLFWIPGEAGAAGGSYVRYPFESMLQTTARGVTMLPALNFERLAITEMCAAEILSVAELSARLGLPIGVVRVVAGDLLADGLLEAFMSNLSVADDVSLIMRL